jgi:hypothetical protein
VVIPTDVLGQPIGPIFRGEKNPWPLKMGCEITQNRAVLNQIDVPSIGNPHIHCHISNTALVLAIVVTSDHQNTIQFHLYQLKTCGVFINIRFICRGDKT